ncbi:hypothetical protein DH2020_042412 [Rehmannia glutinosa]|uniref:25S rRNA (uridine-N(3))-methyltransferase BMT5-like domain-containing protein n=1 Tax=Rehmannia glutinosa TaxID=99300 RepID=A0ABR0UMF0_REHGL
MGILLSFIRYLGSEADDQENNFPESSCKWQNGNCSAQSEEMKYLTISVPNLRYSSSSLTQTSVNDKVLKSSAVFNEENMLQNVCRRERIGMGSSKGNEKEKEERQVMINCTEGRWIKHYSSCHRILLVGEGDFSFSTCLAKAFGWASNMIATSFNSEDFLVKNYQNALPNIVELGIRKCKVMHEIDATKMANHEFLGGIKFDRIIFNFPFAGFFKNLSSDAMLRRHRRLVSLFLKNAKEMITENGEIHITHKTNGFHFEWNLESMAYSQRLRLIEAVDFNLLDYPGYNTKRGFGVTIISIVTLAKPTNLDLSVQ